MNHVFICTIEQQTIVKLLKIIEDMNCPDHALTEF